MNHILNDRAYRLKFHVPNRMNKVRVINANQRAVKWNLDLHCKPALILCCRKENIILRSASLFGLDRYFSANGSHDLIGVKQTDPIAVYFTVSAFFFFREQQYVARKKMLLFFTYSFSCVLFCASTTTSW